ncbi:uncharacterized protein LOC110155955 [Boleophthalmus pectinirostris]|uniref:uncharacterized protein LOC110155955 n=1 Tax=Boleophthalmus pectinirostris TaxID=150288 RepID=UPI00242F5A94|nr:uncharacterized protein LOC110155955 [Boleophthalmus pectinirostris]
MTICRALILVLNISIACGLRCYTCTAAEPRSCTDTKSCPVIFNRCFSLSVHGYDAVTKGCQTSIACVGPMKCCEGDLCNGARQFTGPSFLLLFLSSTAILFFITLLAFEIVEQPASSLYNEEYIRELSVTTVMKMFIKVLSFLMGLSTACALKCYSCLSPTRSCTNIVECNEQLLNRCFAMKVEGYEVKGCYTSLGCSSNFPYCCKGDLCNGFIPTAPSVLLVLLTSAIFTLCVI